MFSYSMEAHLVHFNAKYADFRTALTKSDGLVVLAFFIQAFGNTKCGLFCKISNQIANIEEPNSKCALDSGEIEHCFELNLFQCNENFNFINF